MVFRRITLNVLSFSQIRPTGRTHSRLLTITFVRRLFPSNRWTPGARKFSTPKLVVPELESRPTTVADDAFANSKAP